jgi:hypothetical protein
MKGNDKVAIKIKRIINKIINNKYLLIVAVIFIYMFISNSINNYNTEKFIKNYIVFKK